MTPIIPFIKANGCSNDFVLLDLRDAGVDHRQAVTAALNEQRVREICDRRRGIGADGLLLLTEGAGVVNAEILNADGSPGGMCGNGLRCVALHLLQQGVITAGKAIDIRMGDRTTSVLVERERPFHCSLNLGRVEPGMRAPGQPLDAPGRAALRDIVGRDRFDSAWAGNPHLVVFAERRPTESEVVALARRVRDAEVFGSGVNVSLACAIRPGRVVAVTDERGVGPTQACASGAASIVAIGQSAGILEPTCTVEMPGGDLAIQLLGNTDAASSARNVRISGGAEIAFSGTFPLSARSFEA